MKTLLIVENEKAIRAGIRTMVSRAPVAVETILECRNGEEALNILRSRPVDVMITDIKMPKMDGVKLVHEARKLPEPPIVLVISVYGDYDFVASVFRDKVWDYLLKPIKRDDLYSSLMDIQRELDTRNAEKGKLYTTTRHVLRSLLLGSTISEDELQALSAQHDMALFHENYVAVCLTPTTPLDENTGFFFPDPDGHMILLIPEASLPALNQGWFDGHYAGISSVKQGLVEIRDAWLEACEARKYAFVRGGALYYESLDSQHPQSGKLSATPEQIVQLLGVGNAEKAISLIGQSLFLTQNGRLSPEQYLVFMDHLFDGIMSAYAHIPLIAQGHKAFATVYAFESAFEHFTVLSDCLRELSDTLTKKMENLNRQKIHLAIDFIHKNFRSDINMATVSNQISMNYTQFSSLFKQYAGKNFPDYLQSVRLDESKRLLVDLSISISSVSSLSGFKNEKHFMRRFKLETGVSPRDYRKNLQSQ